MFVDNVRSLVRLFLFSYFFLVARGDKNVRNELGDFVDIDSSDGPMDVVIIRSGNVVSSGSSDCKPSEHNHTEYHGSEFSTLATTPSSARLSGNVTDDKHACSCPPLIPADASGFFIPVIVH